MIDLLLNFSNESEISLANALSRGAVSAAKSFIKPALGNKDALQIEKLLSLSDPRSPSNPEGYALTNEQRLEFLQQLDIDASNMMKTLLKDSNCFTPNIKARIFSHFWLILDTRPFIRTLITLATLCEEMGQYQLAYDYGLRILTYNFVENNGVQTNFNLLQTLLGRDLEAYNFSFDLLVQHLDWDGFERENRGKNYPMIIFDKFKRKDINPQGPAIYGTSIRHRTCRCISSLHRCSCIFQDVWTLSKGDLMACGWSPQELSYPSIFCTLMLRLTPKNACFLHFCSRPMQAWLRLAGSNFPKRKCDFLVCEKVESFLGEWRRCTGCFEAYYCGSECQKEHWKLPGELGRKQECKEAKLLRFMS